MRALGREDRARQAEHFAAWVRLQLDEPEVARLLYPVIKDLREASRLGPLLDRALDGALSLLDADRGNIQILNPVTGALRIAAARGFSPEFLDYFAVVDDDGTACGRAAAQRAQTVIADVSTDPGFAAHREIAAASGFRAVQSTPLTDQAGRLFGVISTHYPRPYRPPDRDLLLARRFGELVGAIMAGHLSTARHDPAGDSLGRAVASVYGSQPILADSRSMTQRNAAAH
jgi:GAF domain-containing protein